MDTQVQQPTTQGTDEEPMLGLTEKAAEKVREIQAAENIEANYGLRLRVVGGGCSGFAYDLYFDQVTEMDRTCPAEGVSTAKSPPPRMNMPWSLTLVVTVPIRPHATAASTTAPIASSAIQLRRDVIRMSWSSCSGEESRSSELCRKMVDIGAQVTSNSRTEGSSGRATRRSW